MTNEERFVLEAARKYNASRDTQDFSAFIEAALALPPAAPPAPKPETREICIAVVIGQNGNAGISVVAHGNVTEALEYAHEWADIPVVAQGIVRASIPVIAIPVVTGTVEDAP